jgi:hypothetical protein
MKMRPPCDKRARLAEQQCRDNFERLTRSPPGSLAATLDGVTVYIAPFIDGACPERSRRARNDNKESGNKPERFRG